MQVDGLSLNASGGFVRRFWRRADIAARPATANQRSFEPSTSSAMRARPRWRTSVPRTR